MTEACVSGLGVCCPLGDSPQDLWDAVARGSDGFRAVDRFPGLPLAHPVASCWSEAEFARFRGEDDPAVNLAVEAGRRALADAGLERPELVVAATSAGAAEGHLAVDRLPPGAPAQRALMERGGFSDFARRVALRLRCRGPQVGVSTACASGGHALGLALELLRSGRWESVLVIGADVVHPSLFLGFHSVGAIAEGPCSPFGLPPGMALGEGAAAVVLEQPQAARRRRARVWGKLLGWGGSSDGWHPTAPEPRGEGVERSMRWALRDAGCAEEAVGYVNAHGTGTAANDPAEAAAVRRLLGAEVPVSSSKSQLGHTQGAAGVLEAAVTLLGLHHQALPPSLRSRPARRGAPADTVSEGRARQAPLRVAVSNSSAFGGTNVALVLGREATDAPDGTRERVYVAGWGTAGPWGGRDLLPILNGNEPPQAGEALDLDLRRWTGARAARGMDPLSRLLVSAGGRALSRSGGPGRGASEDGCGLLVGLGDGPQASSRAFVDGTEATGRAPATAFARMVANAATGVLSFTHQLRGPSLTLWTGAGAGLLAIALGSMWTARDGPLDRLLCGGADELGYVTAIRRQLHPGPSPADSAAAGLLVLTRRPEPVELARAAWGRADRPEATLREACQEPVDLVLFTRDRVPDPTPLLRGLHPEALCVDIDARLGFARAANGALGAVAAAEALSAGALRSALVLSASPETGCTAVLLRTA